MCFLIIFQRFDRIILFQVEIPQNDLIAGFHREFGGKLFHLFERVIVLLQRIIQFIFLHGKRLAHAYGRFEGVISIDRLPDFTFLRKRIRQVIVQLRFSGIIFYKLLILVRRLAEHTEVAAHCRQRQPVGKIIGTVSHRTPQHLQRLFRTIQLGIKRRKFV